MMGEALWAPKQMPELRLRFVSADGRVRSAVVEGESVIIGRGAAAGVRVDDPEVSDVHLLIRRRSDGSVLALDLGTEGGTFLSGSRLERPTRLVPGDALKLGRTSLEVNFELRAAPMSVPAPAPAVAAPPGLKQRAQAPVEAPFVKPPEPAKPAYVFEAPKAKVKEPVRAPPAASSRPAVSAPPPPLAPPPAFLEREVPQAPAGVDRVLQVAAVWGDQILSIRHFAAGEDVVIGDGARVDFFAALAGRRFRLARFDGQRFTVQVPDGASLSTLGTDVRKPERGKRISLGLSERAKVGVGSLSFLIRAIPRPEGFVASKKLSERDLPFLKVVAGTALASALFFIALALMPKSNPPGSEELSAANQQMVRLLMRPPPPPKPAKVTKKAEEKPQGDEGEKVKGDEGTMGKPDAKQEMAAASKEGSPITEASKREKDRQRISKVGLLGALGNKNALANLTGPGGIGTGINNALGGLSAAGPTGDQRGAGGVGTRGIGTGGGGQGLGLGGLGTQGGGRGGGGNGIDFAGKEHNTVRIVPGKTNVVGGLSKEVIAKVIQSHQSEIKYCYEAELQKTPNLSGKVAAMFVIGPDGSVSEANVAETSLNNTSAENCMMARIKRWKFPEPVGGGVVTVTFPWIFNPAGSAKG
jgi:outer membrane biosynthesis protein TonB